MFAIEAAEPVIAHRCLRHGRCVDILLVQQLQRHPDPGQLSVNPGPVRLREDALMNAAAGEHGRIHLGFRLFRDVIPDDAEPVRCIEHRLDAIARDALRRGDRPA